MKKPQRSHRSDPAVNVTKLLIPLLGDDVAPRFDLAPEALIAVIHSESGLIEDRTIILPEASAESLCHLILAEKVDTVVCCGIEDEYYQYLIWKKLKVIDSVMGPYVRVLDKAMKGTLSSGDNLLGSRTSSKK
ncbi:MAG: dinitrogenase iron-molybdenum cofactor biosynthesis protein [Desulfomonile tiedjei]|nr:dinitrogenase iron-molybdenum cofactor biosynthesis protein [Desulfomonile tiedjei]